MNLKQEDARTLAALVSAEETHPELKPLLTFYGAIYRAQFEAKAGLSERDIEIMPQPVCRERLESGEIQLTLDQLHVDSSRFVKLVRQMACIIAEDSPGWELPNQPLDTSALSGMAHNWFQSGEPVIGNGPPTTLVTLTVGLALSSYLQYAAESVLPLVEQCHWQRNVCLICGGKPGLAVLSQEDGSRSLFCSRCDGLWSYRRTTCPFCDNSEGIAYYPSEDQVYRLYVCPACKRYLKTIDLRRAGRKPALPVERILTVGLDLAAQQEGFLYC